MEGTQRICSYGGMQTQPRENPITFDRLQHLDTSNLKTQSLQAEDFYF